MISEESGGSDQNKAHHGSQKLLRLFLALALFCLVGLAVAAWMWQQGRATPVAGRATARPAETATAIPSRTAVTDVPGDGMGLIVGPATPWAVAGGPGDTGELIAPDSDEEQPVQPVFTPSPIELFGPPPASAFGLDAEVGFLWDWPADLADGQQFVLYLETDSERRAMGTARVPNLGQAYRISVELGEVVEEAGNYRWVVVLEDESNAAIIAQSESRPITIAGG